VGIETLASTWGLHPVSWRFQNVKGGPTLRTPWVAKTWERQKGQQKGQFLILIYKAAKAPPSWPAS
jgi:hypothetical protein